LGSNQDLLTHRYNLQLRIEALQDEFLDRCADYKGYSEYTLLSVPIKNLSVSLRRKCKFQRKLLAEIDSCRATMELIDRIVRKRSDISTESQVAEAVASDGPMTTLNSQENFEEAAGADVEIVSAGVSSGLRTGQDGTLDMGQFLSRPVEIYKLKVTAGSPVDIRLSVWDIWSLIPSVRAKLRNFAFLRGNMKVRISVAGTPFHYGRLLASYQPYADYNANITNLLVAYNLQPTDFRPLLLNYLSQAPGSALINVNENIPTDVECPFISTKPMHRLFNSSSTAIAALTSLDDFADAGDLFILSVNTIKAVSASPTPVYIQIYAWMEDVELGVGTGTQMVITTESKVVRRRRKAAPVDEREIGPVENIASRVAQISRALVGVPFIAPFAEASSMMASGVSSLAAIMGWSKPVPITHPMHMRNDAFHNDALTIGCDMSKRVVLDPKQELTVDPRVCGGSEDEMTIQHISSRSTYFKTFAWNDTDAALVAPIWTCAVIPSLATHVTKSTNQFMQPTAMCFAAQPFHFWRGDIIFKFDIVCSSFHRGKLAIFFEPNVAQAVLINADLSLNKQFVRVVDI